MERLPTTKLHVSTQLTKVRHDYTEFGVFVIQTREVKAMSIPADLVDEAFISGEDKRTRKQLFNRPSALSISQRQGK